MRYSNNFSTLAYLEKQVYHVKLMLQVGHVFMLQSIMGELINYFW